MKKTIAGIVYDTENAMPLCTYKRSGKDGDISETSMRTPSDHYFLVQSVGSGQPAIIPMDNEDMAKWSSPAYDSKKPWK